MADNIEGRTRPQDEGNPPTRVRGVPLPANLGLWAALCTCALLAFLVVRYCYWNEGSAPNIVFILGLTGLQTALLVLLTRRLLVSVVIGAAAVAIIVTASTVKVELMHMAIHAYDIFYYMASPATLMFLVVNFTAEMLLLMGAFFSLGLATYLSHRVDPTRIPRLHTAAAVIALGAVTWIAAQSKDARADWRLFQDGAALTKFYGSWPEAMDALWRGQLIDAAPEPARSLFGLPETCRTQESKPPHVILIHQESVVPPEFFPALSYDAAMDPMFRSSDGTLRKLRVETYAGASWLTEFSLFSGVSTYAFGSMRPFVQALMAGKVRDTLPEAFARCGYRNVVFYPLDKNFVSNGRFYESIGLTEIFDAAAQGASLSGERDRFYYDQFLSLLDEHTKTSTKPLFTYLITFATHQPYDRAFQPELDVPGGGPGTDPHMHEFLRRLSMARIDYDAFKQELSRRFPNERFLLVHFGDHQPGTTWTYLTDADRRAIRIGTAPETQRSKAYLTYYAVEGLNYDPPELPDVEVLDVPYLGLAVLEAARLPLSESYLRRKQLMALCDGRYASCGKRDDILAFHRRLIDSGLLVAR